MTFFRASAPPARGLWMAPCACSLLALTACGGSSPASPTATYTVRAAVIGLSPGNSVTLVNNGVDALTVPTDMTANFAAPLADGAAYAVTIGAQPTGQSCAVTNGTGTVRSANVGGIAVTCTVITPETFSIGGSVAGLSPGTFVALSNNGADAVTLTSDGNFVFPTALQNAVAYAVSVANQPSGETCVVTAGDGVVEMAAVTAVSIVCTANGVVPPPTYTIGGMVSGLGAGQSLLLLNNGTQALTVSANGAYAFSTGVADGSAYAVTVATQPPGVSCAVSAGSGTVAAANVTSVDVTCTVVAPATFSIGGTVTGLPSGQSVVMLVNGGNALSVAANGSFAFKTPLTNGAAYLVAVGTQPGTASCTVSAGSGTVNSANVSNVAVACSLKRFTVGGTISGLTTGQSVVLLDSGADALTVAANGSFVFKTSVASGNGYAVTVGTQPTSEICTVSGGTGTIGATNVSSVSIACSAKRFTVGGSVSGLTTGKSLSLLDNGGDALTLTANGAFVFKTAVASGARYAVTVGTQPSGLTCSVSAGTGTITTASVINVAVACVVSRYTIGGAVSGLASGQSVVLLDNAADSLAVAANGAFAFQTAVASGSAYVVTVGTRPVGSNCSVTGGSGAVAGGNVTNVVVACAPVGASTWVPFQATPAAGTTGGKAGLFVLPADKLSASPAATFVNTRAANTVVSVISQYYNYADTTQVPQSGIGALIYSATGSDGNVHLYGIKLTDTSVVPVEHQISNLRIDPNAGLCIAGSAQTNLADATTYFIVMSLPTANGCWDGTSPLSVVHFTDSATTAPTATTLDGTNFSTGGQFSAVYQANGQLGGLVLLDLNAQSLNFYADATFTHPKVMLTGVSANNLLFDASTALRGQLYQRIGLATDSGLYKALYGISATGTATRIYAASGQIGYLFASDATNFYFSDSATNDTILQEKLTGVGTPLALYSAPANSVSLVGSNGSVLALRADSFGDTSQTLLSTIPTGRHSTTTNAIGSQFNYTGGLGTSMYPLSAAPNVIYINLTDTIYNDDGSATYSYSSELLGVDGTVKQALQANSNYLVPASSPGFTAALQVQGITDVNGGYGHGTLSSVDVGSLAKTPLTAAAGTSYTFTGGFVAYPTFGLPTTGALYLTASISFGTAPDLNLAYDLTRNFILPVTFPNTAITTY